MREMWTPGRQDNPISGAAPKPSVGFWSWGSRVLDGLVPELTRLRKRRNWQARKSIGWVIRPQRIGTASPQAKTPQGTERVPRYSQLEDHALNLREPAPTSWTPPTDRLYTLHPAHRKFAGDTWEL